MLSLNTLVSRYGDTLQYLPISERTLATLGSLTNQIPEEMSPFWGFEIPLSTAENTSDFLFCVSNRMAFEKFMQSEVAKTLFDREVLHMLQDVSKSWNDKQCLLSSVQNFWFEYDYAESFLGARPNLFFAPSPDENFLRTISNAKAIFQDFIDPVASQNLYKALLELLMSLPENAWASQIGMMLARNNTSFRVYVQDIPASDLKNFLIQKNIYGALKDQFDEHFAKCIRYSSQVNIDLDISDRTNESIGLECYFSKLSSVESFLKEYHESGMVEDNKYNRILDYMEHLTIDPNQEHQHLISHIKVSMNKKKSNLKIYIGVAQNEVAKNLIQTNYQE